MHYNDVIEALPAVEKFTRRYAGSNFSTDIMSEIKVRALELGFEKRGVKIESWMCEIAKNVCKSQFKAKTRNPIVFTDFMADQIGRCDYQPSIMEEKEMIRLIHSLPAMLKRILLLTMAGYKCREIAKKLNIKRTSVKTALWIARNTLKNKLKAQVPIYSLV